MAGELLSDLVLHELDELVLDAGALRFGGEDLALGGVDALLLVVVLLLALLAGEVQGQQAVDHQVRVAADRGGEMGVELEGEAVVADVVGRVGRLRHRAEGDHLEGVELRLAFRLAEQVGQRAGDLGAVAGRAELVAEMLREGAEVLDFLGVGLVVDAVDEGLRVLRGDVVHLAVRRDELRDGPVREEHELLDQPVGLVRDGLVDADRLAVLVDVDLHLRALEHDRAVLETVPAEDGREGVQGEDGRLFGDVAEDDFLDLLVVVAAVRADDGAADPAVDDLGLRGDLEDGREGQLVLVGAQGAELVAELLREHRDGPVHEIDGRAAGLGLLVDFGARADVPGDVRDVDADLVIAVREGLERQGVVVVLRVGGVDREGIGVPEVLAAFQVLFGNLFGNLVGGILDLLLEAVGEAVFREDRMHFRVVLARHAEDVDDVAPGADLVAVPVVHDDGGLHAGPAAHLDGLLLVDGDVVGHVAALHQDPGLGADEVEDADEGLGVALEDFDDLAFAAAVTAVLLEDRDADGVAVEGVLRARRLDVDILILTLYDDENESVAGHLDFSGIDG